jgi:hypothetical protein
MRQLAWSVPVLAERDTREPLDDHTAGGVRPGAHYGTDPGRLKAFHPLSWRDINKLGGSIILMRAIEVAGRPESSPTYPLESEKRGASNENQIVS